MSTFKATTDISPSRRSALKSATRDRSASRSPSPVTFRSIDDNYLSADAWKKQVRARSSSPSPTKLKDDAQLSPARMESSVAHHDQIVQAVFPPVTVLGVGLLTPRSVSPTRSSTRDLMLDESSSPKFGAHPNQQQEHASHDPPFLSRRHPRTVVNQSSRSIRDSSYSSDRSWSPTRAESRSSSHRSMYSSQRINSNLRQQQQQQHGVNHHPNAQPQTHPNHSNRSLSPPRTHTTSGASSRSMLRRNNRDVSPLSSIRKGRARSGSELNSFGESMLESTPSSSLLASHIDAATDIVSRYRIKDELEGDSLTIDEFRRRVLSTSDLKARMHRVQTVITAKERLIQTQYFLAWKMFREHRKVAWVLLEEEFQDLTRIVQRFTSKRGKTFKGLVQQLNRLIGSRLFDSTSVFSATRLIVHLWRHWTVGKRRHRTAPLQFRQQQERLFKSRLFQSWRRVNLMSQVGVDLSQKLCKYRYKNDTKQVTGPILSYKGRRIKLGFIFYQNTDYSYVIRAFSGWKSFYINKSTIDSIRIERLGQQLGSVKQKLFRLWRAKYLNRQRIRCWMQQKRTSKNRTLMQRIIGLWRTTTASSIRSRVSLIRLLNRRSRKFKNILLHRWKRNVERLAHTKSTVEIQRSLSSFVNTKEQALDEMRQKYELEVLHWRGAVEMEQQTRANQKQAFEKHTEKLNVQFTSQITALLNQLRTISETVNQERVEILNHVAENQQLHQDYSQRSMTVTSKRSSTLLSPERSERQPSVHSPLFSRNQLSMHSGSPSRRSGSPLDSTQYQLNSPAVLSTISPQAGPHSQTVTISSRSPNRSRSPSPLSHLVNAAAMLSPIAVNGSPHRENRR